MHHPRVARRMAQLALLLMAHTRPHRPHTVVRRTASQRTASQRTASRTLSPIAITASRPAEARALLVEEVPGTGPHSLAQGRRREVRRARAAATRRYRQPPADLPS